jgi:hypothetical protein
MRRNKMNKTVSFIIMIMAMVLLFYTPIIAGEKNNRERVYRDDQYWIFRSDPDASKSGWRSNPNFGDSYSERSYGGNNDHGNKGHSGKGGKKGK